MADPSLELREGVRVAWDEPAKLREGLAASPPSAAWRIDGELGAERSEIRVLTGAAGAGALLLLAAARPEPADGHDAGELRAILVSDAGQVTVIDEALVSTQYDADGQVQRVGLELYAAGDDYPLRGAGDATGVGRNVKGPVPLTREQILLAFRLDGEAGTASLEIVRA